MKRSGGSVSAIALTAALSCLPNAAMAKTSRAVADAYEAATTASLNLASLASSRLVEAQAAAAGRLASAQSERDRSVEPSTPVETAPVAPPARPDAAADAPLVPQTPAPRRDINPYDRDVAMTVPLQFNDRVLGEMPVLLTRDDRFLVESRGFQALLEPLLTPEAQAELATALAGIERFESDFIQPTGIRLDYDPDQLAVLLLRIDPTKRTIESLFRQGEPEEPGLPPEAISAYLNLNLAAQRFQSTGDVRTPSVFLNGAARFGSFVFEADVQGREDFFTKEYSFERQFARVVYDQPEAYRRWSLGDLDVEQRGRQGFVELGGVGVERQTRRFDSFRNDSLVGARQLVLQEASSVRVLRNGLTVREFRLEPGQYDLSNLPLLTGSNDIELQIQGDAGRTESVRYSAYLDQIDLEPGDYEYAAFLGVTSARGFGAPDYSDGDLAFTGFWRKAFVDRPAVGLGLQASADLQLITGQTQFIIANGARLQLDAAVSNGPDGAGYAGTISYNHFVDRGEQTDAWAVAVDYTSDEFATLGNIFGDNQTAFAFSGSYSRRFTIDWQANVSASYRTSRSALQGDSYNLTATNSYRFSPNWSALVGVEYVNFGNEAFGGRAGGFGVTFGLVWQPRFDQRGEVRYGSATNTANVSFQKYSDNRVGALGYNLNANYNDGAGSISGQADYIANRFDASLAHTTFGRDFSDITEEQVTSLRIGTSIATAGGKVAIGRNIFDSFAILYPHPSLKDRRVIVGDNLENGQFISRSDRVGPAISNQLTSYINQSLRYDVIEPPAGYNIGDGVARVRPTYRSGYAIQVGSANFVSAMGRLVGNADRPVALMSGRVRPVDAPEAEPELFFTNSVGRFAIQNLEPGKRYRVELFSTPALGFEFTVPEDNEGLLDLQVLNVPLDVPE